MNIYRIYITFAVLLTCCYMSCTQTGYDNMDDEISEFIIEDTSKVTLIKIKDELAEIQLQRQNSSWTVNGLPTKQTSIEYILRTTKRLKLKSPIPIAQKDSMVNVLKTKGIEMRFYNGSSSILHCFVAAPLNGLEGATFILHNSPNPYHLYLPGFATNLLPLFQTNLNYWRDNTVFKYLPSDIVEIEIIHPRENIHSFRLNVSDSTETLYLNSSQEKTTPSTEAVQQYLTYFWNVKYDYTVDNLTNNERHTITESIPLNIIKVTDKTGKCVELTIYEKIKENNKTDLNKHFATIKGRDDILIMRYITTDALTKKDDYFLLRKK